MSTQALASLGRVRATTGGLEWAFPSRRGGHITWLQKNSQRLMADLPFTFRPHDLRRTAATGMSELGIDDVTIAKILNHKWADRQITSVYNRWQRLPEMRQALERWGARVEQIVTGQPAKVIHMRGVSLDK